MMRLVLSAAVLLSVSAIKDFPAIPLKDQVKWHKVIIRNDVLKGRNNNNNLLIINQNRDLFTFEFR